MDQETYLKRRVEDQFNWLDKKSKSNQKYYKNFRFTATFLSILIPFATGFITADRDWLKIAIGVAGLLIAIIEFILATNKYHENWINYRSAAEALKRERNLFETKSGQYQYSETPFNDFVVQIESILSQENSNWKKYLAKGSKTKA